jgi:hypothetical protein
MQKSFYFQHDYNAASDSKVLFLRQQLGMEGYGIYWFVLEQLAQAGGFLPLKIIPVLAMQSQTQETKLNAVVKNYELFELIEDQFFSTRLNAHLQIRKHLSDKGKAGASKRWHTSQPDSLPNSLPISDPNAKERKGNKGKKENKVNKGNVFIAPQIEEVKLFFEENGYANGDKAWNYYNDADWKDSTGKPVKNWKQKMRGVWFKDENRKQAPKEKVMTLTAYIDQQKALGNEDFM